MTTISLDEYETEVGRVYKSMVELLSTESTAVGYGALVHMLGTVMFSLHHKDPDELFDHTIEGLEIVFNATVDANGEVH